MILFRVVLLFVLSGSLASLDAQSFLQHEYFNQSGVDSIDLDTLSVQLSFPILNKAGRGVPTTFAAAYHGDLWTVWAGIQWEPTSAFGWNTDIFTIPGSFSESQIGESVCQRATSRQAALYITTYGRRTWTDGLGLVHSFPGQRTENDCTGADTSYANWSYSGDGYSVDSMYGVYDPHGNYVNSVTPVDSNGNSLALAPSCANSLGGAECIQDTTGQPTLASDGMNYVGGQTTAVHYYYYDNSGNKQTITVNYSQLSVRTNFGVAGVSEFGPQQESLPTSITYPDGTYYITYEPTPGYSSSTTARVASLTLPTGAVIQYSYPGANDSNMNDGTLSAVNRTTNNSTISFTRSEPTATTATTTVAYPSGRTDLYSFARPQVPTQSTAYMTTGVSEGGQTVSVCYSGASGYPYAYNCATDNIYFPVESRQITTTLDNGLSSVTSETYNGAEMLTERDETDFAASNPAVVQKTLIAYNSSFADKFDRVQQVTVEDSGSNVIARTSYGYDETSTVTTSGLPNHQVPSTPPGNLTSVTRYNSGGQSLITKYTYDDAGQVQTVSGPGPGQTTFQYDSTDTYVTNTTMPQVGAVALQTSATHNAYTGQLASETDANLHTVLYQYDTSLRLLSTTNDTQSGGDGAVATHVYNSSNVQISTTHTIGNGSSTDTEVFTDGYGRTNRIAQATGSNSWTVSDTCFNVDGQVSFESLPYTATSVTGASVCSGAGDAYNYDIYGRINTITHADNSQVNYVYAGRAVKVTDEGANGVKSTRVVQSDGLGRLAFVCEYSTGTGMVGSPAASGCGTDMNTSGHDTSSTGFLTSYSYDLANRIMTVSQSGANRSWQYDSLGRTISEQIPERAEPTTYTYTYNSTGLVIARTRLAPNQLPGTNSPNYVTTTSQSDALGRLSSTAYDDGSTPTVSYVYDAGLSNPQSHNMLGELGSATVGSIVQQFSYTANGQIEWERTCLASTCGTNTPTFVQQSFGYNQLQSATNVTDGAGNAIGYAYDTVGRLNTVSESLQGAGFPTNLLSGFQYGPFGVTAVSFGNGLLGSYGYDGRGRQNSFQAQTASNVNTYGYSLLWGANGSVIHSVDTQNDTWTYGYDEFRRLVSAATDSGSQGYGYQYDVWGNRWGQNVTKGSGYTVSNTFDPALTNQVVGWTYYLDGNVYWDGQHYYSYDAEDRVLTADSTFYSYGPDGSRVNVTKPQDSRDYVYTPSGQLSSLWRNGSLLKANVYVGGSKLGSYTGTGVSFEYGDWTGSTRVVTNAAGAVTASYTSLPFGNMISPPGDSDQAQTSGLDWDSESQSGHAWARQYNPQNAVWMSPDPYGGSYDWTNPQSLNRYAYVGNDPMSFSDPTGLARETDAPEDGASSAFSDFYGNAVGGTPSGMKDCGGAKSVCPGLLRRVWDWLSSFLNSNDPGNGPEGGPYGDSSGLGRHYIGMFFQGGSHLATPAQQSNAPVPSSATQVGTQDVGSQRDYTYQVNDQNGKPLVPANDADLTVTEHSVMVSHTGDPVNIHTTNDQKTGTAGGQFVDTVGPRKVIPGTTFNEHSRQTFKATYKGKSYKLSTVVHQHVQVQNGRLVHRDATVINP